MKWKRLAIWKESCLQASLKMEWTWWKATWIELEMFRQQATACYRLVQSDTGLKNKMPSHILHVVYPQVKHICSFPCFGVLFSWGLVLSLMALISSAYPGLSFSLRNTSLDCIWVHVKLRWNQSLRSESNPSSVKDSLCYSELWFPFIWPAEEKYTSAPFTSALFINNKVVWITSSSTFFSLL